jgi:hypothetical protein
MELYSTSTFFSVELLRIIAVHWFNSNPARMSNQDKKSEWSVLVKETESERINVEPR